MDLETKLARAIEQRAALEAVIGEVEAAVARLDTLLAPATPRGGGSASASRNRCAGPGERIPNPMSIVTLALGRQVRR
jgi:hypothetical protein